MDNETRHTLFDILIMLLVALFLLTGCITLPDGRRVLSPAARNGLGDVLACGGGLALSAIGGAPDYAAAATCHLDRVRNRLDLRSNVNSPTPSPEHGRLVVAAAEAEQEGDHDLAVDLSKKCEALARQTLRSGAAP